MRRLRPFLATPAAAALLLLGGLAYAEGPAMLAPPAPPSTSVNLAPAPPAPPATHRPRTHTLTPAQQAARAKAQAESAKEAERRWEALSPQEKKEILESYDVWKSMKPERRERLKNAYRTFKALPPQKQRELRQKANRLKEMSPEEKEKVKVRIQRWRDMTPEEREAYREKAKRLEKLPPVGAPEGRGRGGVGIADRPREIAPERREQPFEVSPERLREPVDLNTTSLADTKIALDDVRMKLSRAKDLYERGLLGVSDLEALQTQMKRLEERLRQQQEQLMLNRELMAGVQKEIALIQTQIAGYEGKIKVGTAALDDAQLLQLRRDLIALQQRLAELRAKVR